MTPTEHALLTVTDWLVSITFWVSFAFPIVTRLFWNWWASWWGRNIVALEVCIAITLLPSVALRYLGLEPEVETLLWIQTFALATVPLVVIWRVAMIWHDQRHYRPEDPQERVSRLKRELAEAIEEAGA